MYDSTFVSMAFPVSLPVSLYTELQRLGDVLRADPIVGCQIRDGARHLPYPIEAAGAERHPADRRVQQPHPVFVDRAVPGREPRRELGVRPNRVARISILLSRARRD